MSTRFPRVLTAAMLLAMTSTFAIAQAPPPQSPPPSRTSPSDQPSTSQPSSTDETPSSQMPTKQQCDDMKKNPSSTMSKSEHDAMMKKCKDMDKKSKSGY